MITLNLRPGLSNGPKQTFCYRLAQQDLISDLPIPALAGYAQQISKTHIHSSLAIAWRTNEAAKLLYQGPSWIGNGWRQVTGYSLLEGCRIEVAGIGAYWIAKDGKEIVCTRQESEAGIDLLIEAAIGPALILALALGGTWCLHGSAVEFKDRIIAFIGESGKGKSTLAHWLDGQDALNWRRLGDDILPVSLRDDRLDYLLHFPQPKLPADQQPSMHLDERLPLDAMYVLRRPTSRDERVVIHSLQKQEGALSLVRHTVASRLFDSDLLSDHLDFCVRAGSLVPLRDLVYPLRPGALQDVQEALLEDIGPLDDSSDSLAFPHQSKTRPVDLGSGAYPGMKTPAGWSPSVRSG